MDNLDLDHMAQWTQKQFREAAFDVFTKMVALAIVDPTYWSEQSYWLLYDAAMAKDNSQSIATSSASVMGIKGRWA